MVKLTTFGLGFFDWSASSGWPLEVPGLLLLLELDLRGRAQLRQPLAEVADVGGSAEESWLRFVFIVLRDPWDGARLSDRLLVPGKTYSLMLFLMLFERLGGLTAVDGRAWGSEGCSRDDSPLRIHSVAVALAAASEAGSMDRFRRVEELLSTVSDGGITRAGPAVLSQICLPLLVAVVEPAKVGTFTAAVGTGGCIAGLLAEGEFGLLEASCFKRRLEVDGGAGGQAHFGL